MHKRLRYLLMFLVLTAFFSYQQIIHMNRFSGYWDHKVYIMNGYWIAGKRFYVEVFRYPLPCMIYAALLKFLNLKLAIVAYSSLVSFLVLVSIKKFSKFVKIDEEKLLSAFLTLYFIKWANAEGTEALALSFLLLAISSTNIIAKSAFLALAGLSRYSFLTAGLLLLPLSEYIERKKISNSVTAAVLGLATSLLFNLAYSKTVFGDPKLVLYDYYWFYRIFRLKPYPYIFAKDLQNPLSYLAMFFPALLLIDTEKFWKKRRTDALAFAFIFLTLLLMLPAKLLTIRYLFLATPGIALLLAPRLKKFPPEILLLLSVLTIIPAERPGEAVPELENCTYMSDLWVYFAFTNKVPVFPPYAEINKENMLELSRKGVRFIISSDFAKNHGFNASKGFLRIGKGCVYIPAKIVMSKIAGESGYFENLVGGVANGGKVPGNS